MATTFSLKQGEKRTSHGPIPHPLTYLLSTMHHICNSMFKSSHFLPKIQISSNRFQFVRWYYNPPTYLLQYTVAPIKSSSASTHKIIKSERICSSHFIFWDNFITIFCWYMTLLTTWFQALRSRSISTLISEDRSAYTMDQKLKLSTYKGVLHLYPKISMLCASWRNSKQHWNLNRPSGAWVIDQNNILTVLIHNLKTAWPNKFQCHYWVPWTIYFKIHTLFFKKMLIILDRAQNMLILSYRCSTFLSLPTVYHA